MPRLQPPARPRLCGRKRQNRRRQDAFPGGRGSQVSGTIFMGLIALSGRRFGSWTCSEQVSDVIPTAAGTGYVVATAERHARCMGTACVVENRSVAARAILTVLCDLKLCAVVTQTHTIAYRR
jgi:hypothetical protein